MRNVDMHSHLDVEAPLCCTLCGGPCMMAAAPCDLNVLILT